MHGQALGVLLHRHLDISEKEEDLLARTQC